MHSLLESYLSEVAAHLAPMPVKQRNEELREMRLHLENALSVSRELGQSTMIAWRRGVMLGWRNCWGAAATTALLICFGLLSINNADWNSILPRTLLRYLSKHPSYGMDFTQATFMVTFGLAGFAVGYLFPNRGIWSVCLGLSLFWIGFAAVDGVGQLQALVSLDGLIYQGRGGWIFAAIVSAWAGSRWRMRRTKRLRLARG